MVCTRCPRVENLSRPEPQPKGAATNKRLSDYQSGWEDCVEALWPLVALAARRDPVAARRLAELARGRCRRMHQGHPDLAELPMLVDREAMLPLEDM